ncbi:hypothetical protein PYCC9005_000170 [Savitreella phatthalungensis]
MSIPTADVAHPPPRKITRTRTGCSTCRARRVKCDEQKPACGACGRLGLKCAYDEVLRPRKRRCLARWERADSTTLEVADLQTEHLDGDEDNSLLHGSETSLEIDQEYDDILTSPGFASTQSNSTITSRALSPVGDSWQMTTTDTSPFMDPADLRLSSTLGSDIQILMPGFRSDQASFMYHFSTVLSDEMDRKHRGRRSRPADLDSVWQTEVLLMAMQPESEHLRDAIVALSAKDIEHKRRWRLTDGYNRELAQQSNQFESDALQGLSKALSRAGDTVTIEVLTTVVLLLMLSVMQDRGRPSRTHLAAAAHMLSRAPPALLCSPIGRSLKRLLTSIDLAIVATRSWAVSFAHAKNFTKTLVSLPSAGGDPLDEPYYQLLGILADIDEVRRIQTTFLTVVQQPYTKSRRARMFAIFEQLLQWHAHWRNAPSFACVERFDRQDGESVAGEIYADPKAALMLVQFWHSLCIILIALNRRHFTTIALEACLARVCAIAGAAMRTTDTTYRDSVMCIDGSLGIYYPLLWMAFFSGHRRRRWVINVMDETIKRMNASAVDLVDPRHLAAQTSSIRFIDNLLGDKASRPMCTVGGRGGLYEDFNIDAVDDVEDALNVGSKGSTMYIIYSDDLRTTKAVCYTTVATGPGVFESTLDESLTAFWMEKASHVERARYCEGDDRDECCEKLLIDYGHTGLLMPS